MKGISEDPAPAWQSDTEAFLNPNIKMLDMTIEGIPTQVYSQRMRSYQQWGEVRKALGVGNMHNPEVMMIWEDLQLRDTLLGEFLTTK